jgi:hypothetical protein
MKKFVLLSAVAATVTFALSDALAKDLVLTVSGSAIIQKTNYDSSTSIEIGTTENLSFNNKQIYSVLSDAVANASDSSLGSISSATLPTDGYIVFNPEGFDGEVFGTFYVTNKEGFSLQLSGTDGDGNYYSWIELDAQNTIHSLGDPVEYGWISTNIVAATTVLNAPFNGVASYKAGDPGSSTPGTGKETDTSTALLYIHDDPYAYDDADNPDIFWNNFLNQGDGDDASGQNFNALEIRGITIANFTYQNFEVAGGNLSLTGSGNLVIGGNYGSVIKTGKATIK